MKKSLIHLAILAMFVGTGIHASEKPWMIVADDFGAYFRGEQNAMTKEGLEAYADSLIAGGQVTHVFWCPVAGRANFAATSTDPIWAGLEDPSTTFGIGKDPSSVIDANRRWAMNAKKLADAGIDPYRVWIDRARAKGVSPWVTICLTDMRYSIDPNYFRTPRFVSQHKEWMMTNPSHGGGAPDFAIEQMREWFKKIVAETVSRYKDVDGIEIDCISGNSYYTFLPHEMPNGRPKREMFNKFVAELKQLIRETSGNKDMQLALRIVNDTNLLVPNFMDGNLPADVLIPSFDSPVLLRDWAEFDRTSAALIIPAFNCNVPLPRANAAAGRIHGRGFPGMMLKSLDKAEPAVRQSLANGTLGGITGPREFVVGQDQHLMEWKRATWGFVDCRASLPWKMNWPFDYEFAMPEGSIAEKSVKVTLTYTGKSAYPESIRLNGWKSTGVVAQGPRLIYSFPNESIIGGVNQLNIPAQSPDTPTAELCDVKGVIIRID